MYFFEKKKRRNKEEEEEEEKSFYFVIYIIKSLRSREELFFSFINLIIDETMYSCVLRHIIMACWFVSLKRKKKFSSEEHCE